LGFFLFEKCPGWAKVEAFKLASRGIHPAPLLIKTIELEGPHAPPCLKELCYVCGAMTGLKCGGCRSISYCTRDCQKKDRKRHRPFCGVPQPQQQDSKAAPVVPPIPQQQQQNI